VNALPFSRIRLRVKRPRWVPRSALPQSPSLFWVGDGDDRSFGNGIADAGHFERSTAK
jgi:hypothetical protein